MLLDHISDLVRQSGVHFIKQQPLLGLPPVHWLLSKRRVFGLWKLESPPGGIAVLLVCEF